MSKYRKDEIFQSSREKHLMTVGFLTALKTNLGYKKAFEIVANAFTNYMINYYELILSSTRRGSQRRFDKFRQHYEEYARKSGYISVLASKSNVLRVRFERCPFAELMTEYDLGDFSYAFCLSDYVFSKKVLPGVKFRRMHEIVRGDKYCDHEWTFHKEKGNR
jgi:hypothetical protein